MRSLQVVTIFCVMLVCAAATPPAHVPQSVEAAKAMPLILEKNEGEKRRLRGWPGHPEPSETFILKVDPKNGGSAHVVFFTADLPPGQAIDAHRHAHADEILFLQTGTARVHVGDSVKEVHAGSTVFIPAGTSISVLNIGKENIALAAVFSAPGFEDFIRETTYGEGEKNVPISAAEEDAIEKKYAHVVAYQ
jgi:quercetin dioxygenase-like cupin family protein